MKHGNSARSTWPAMIAVAALALALGSFGSAVAGPALTKAKVKAIATKVVNKQAPGLSVARADAVKDGAITSASVADRSLGATDLAVGVVPADGYFLQDMNVGSNPVATPDSANVIARSFSLPRAGTAHLRMFGARFSAACSSGGATGGLYVDGVPVPGTARSLPATGSESAIELVGSVNLAQGNHLLGYGIDCASASSTNTGSAFINATWTVTMTAE